MSEILHLGKTNFRNQEISFGIKDDDRRRHIYIIGKSGVGKSTLLGDMIIEDMREGKGVCVIDPHGELAEDVLKFVPESRLDDVIYFNPSDINYPIAFNPLERVSFEMRHLIASGLMSVFKKIWPDVWSARMEYILNNTLLALLEYPNSTLLGIMKMFSDKAYRQQIVSNLNDPVVRSFWVDEFAKYTQKLETEAVAAIQNKIGQFIANPLIRNIIGQVTSSFDVRKVMDDSKILIVNLSKGKIGEDNSALLGAMMITKLQLAAMSRVDTPTEKRKDFYLYVDEFQNFATESFANILSEARKYRLCLNLAHQYVDQLDEEVRSAVFGNVGTTISFRVGAEDAEFLEKEFSPDFLATDFVNLPNFNFYIKLMIDGMSSKPFSAKTIKIPPPPEKDITPEIISLSREKYTSPREKVEGKIAGEYHSGEQKISDMIKRREERPLREALKMGPEMRGNMDRKKDFDFRNENRKRELGNNEVSDLKNILRKTLVQNQHQKSEEGEDKKDNHQN